MSHIWIRDFPSDEQLGQMPAAFKSLFEEMRELTGPDENEGRSPVLSAELLHEKGTFDLYSNPAKVNFYYPHYCYKVNYAATPERDIKGFEDGPRIIGFTVYDIDDSSLLSIEKLSDSDLAILKKFYNAKNPSDQLQAFAFWIIAQKMVLYYKIQAP